MNHPIELHDGRKLLEGVGAHSGEATPADPAAQVRAGAPAARLGSSGQAVVEWRLRRRRGGASESGSGGGGR